VRYRFSDHMLDVDRRELHRDGVLLALEPQVFDILVHLVHNRDRVVSKDELIKHVWAGRIVSDATLDSRVRTVRLAVGDTGAKQSMIRTIPRRGIRFTAEVLCEPVGTTTTPPLANRLPTIAPLIGSSKPSIAVLPFAHTGDDPMTEHFSDSITQDIITDFTRSRALLVMAGGLPSADKDEPRTDRSSRAAYVLEGQLRVSRGWVRVTVRLIEVAVGGYIWAECFDRERAGIQAAQADIANAVCASVLREISSCEQRRFIQKSRANLNAWEAYQRGLWVASSHGRQEISQAMAYFRQATELDPSFAEPHALLSRFHLIETHRGDSEVFCDALARAESEAIASLRLDPGYSTAHAVLSGVLDYHGDQVGAFEEAERGIALNSGDPWSWFSKGHLLVYGGQWAEVARPSRPRFGCNLRDRSFRQSCITS